jgi:hypothetical protein
VITPGAQACAYVLLLERSGTIAIRSLLEIVI